MMDLANHRAERPLAGAPGRPGAPRAARPARAVLALALPLAAALAGCGASQTDVLARQVESLRSELVKVRAENAALGERLDALELRGGGPRAQAQPPAAQPPAAQPPAAQPPDAQPPSGRTADGDRPPLDVVRLGPAPGGAPPRAGEPEADPPAVLRSAGKAIVEESGPSKGASNPKSLGASPPATKMLDKATQAPPRSISSAAPVPGAKK
jgi:hypothetical protein